MSCRIRFTYRDGRSGLLGAEYTTRTEAEQAILRLNDWNCMTYTVEEVVPTAAVPDATPEHTASQWPGFAAWQEDRVRVQEAQIARLRAELAQALALGDAMHAVHPSEEWAAYRGGWR